LFYTGDSPCKCVAALSEHGGAANADCGEEHDYLIAPLTHSPLPGSPDLEIYIYIYIYINIASWIVLHRCFYIYRNTFTHLDDELDILFRCELEEVSLQKRVP